MGSGLFGFDAGQADEAYLMDLVFASKKPAGNGRFFYDFSKAQIGWGVIADQFYSQGAGALAGCVLNFGAKVGMGLALKIYLTTGG